MTLQAEIVQKNFTGPLVDAFPSLTAGMCKTAIQRMGDLPGDVLRQTADWLIDNCKHRPAISEMLDASRQVQNKISGGIADADQSRFPWVVAQEKAMQMVSDYMEAKKNSPLMVKATQEKWDSQLLAYVREMAWVQAQRLAGVKNRGWQSRILLPELSPKERKLSAAELFKRYILPQVEEAVSLGRISVTVPNWVKP